MQSEMDSLENKRDFWKRPVLPEHINDTYVYIYVKFTKNLLYNIKSLNLENFFLE